jgi:hypothetical protein
MQKYGYENAEGERLIEGNLYVVHASGRVKGEGAGGHGGCQRGPLVDDEPDERSEFRPV